MRSAEVAPDAPQGKSRLMGRSAGEDLLIGDATGIGHGTAREPNPHAPFVLSTVASQAFWQSQL